MENGFLIHNFQLKIQIHSGYKAHSGPLHPIEL